MRVEIKLLTEVLKKVSDPIERIIWAVLTYQENFDPNGGIRSQMLTQYKG